MNTKRKTIKMPVRYLMNLVLVGLLFVGLSYVSETNSKEKRRNDPS